MGIFSSPEEARRLFNDAFYLHIFYSVEVVTHELERMQKEAVMAYFKELPRICVGG